MNEYRFQLQIIGVGEDEDDALNWALQQLGKKNIGVLEGEIVFEMIGDEGHCDSDASIKPGEWVTVIPEA